MENKEKVFFKIGDLGFSVESDLPFQLPVGDSGMFRVNASEKCDYLYRIEKHRDITQYTGNTKLIDQGALGFELVNENGQHFRALAFGNGFYDVVISLDEKIGTIAYANSGLILQRFEEQFDITNYLALEYLFFRFGGLFLHSSHVRVGDKALIFSAPSGTGKSTQADLWEKYAGAEVMNGDRTLLRKKDGVWHAYGCPMCGTSGIHKQGNEPIHAIVMLSQGTENTVRKLTPGEAFQRMYPEITVPKWNRELVLRAMELLDDVMANVPIYAFSCTKDESAVTALREAIGL